MTADGLWEPRGKAARGIVIVAMLVNLIASLLMATLMKNTTAVGGSDEARMAFIAEHASFVRAFWYCWELATLSLVATFVTVLRSLDAPGTTGLRVLSFAILALGAIPDSINNLIGAEALPYISMRWAAAPDGPFRQALVEDFHVWDRMSVVLTGALANGLYAAGGWLLMASCYKTAAYPRVLCHIQWPFWAATSGMAIAAIADSVTGLVVTVGAALSLMVLWTAGTAWLWLGRSAPTSR